MRNRARELLLGAAAAGLCLAACSQARAEGEVGRRKSSGPSKADLTSADFDGALAAIRRIALDEGESAEHRANAVTAYVRAALWRTPHGAAASAAARRRQLREEARAFCRTVLEAAQDKAVLEAALRAGALVERSRRGHLRAELDFLASWARGRTAQAAASVRREVLAAVGALAALSAKAMVPPRVVVSAPAWSASEPGKSPRALNVTPPRIAPPGWLGRVTFRLLKEPRK